MNTLSTITENYLGFQMAFTHGIKLNPHFMCKGSSFAIFLHIFYNMS